LCAPERFEKVSEDEELTPLVSRSHQSALEAMDLSGQAAAESEATELGSRAQMAVAAVMVAITSIIYFSWWLQAGRVTNPWLLLSLALAFLYITAQVYGACYVYLKMQLPPVRGPFPGHSVDVFVPVYDESPELVEECLRAAVAMRYPHKTYLIDDRRDPEMQALARAAAPSIELAPTTATRKPATSTRRCGRPTVSSWSCSTSTTSRLRLPRRRDRALRRSEGRLRASGGRVPQLR
jgi:hypothetical protein